MLAVWSGRLGLSIRARHARNNSASVLNHFTEPVSVPIAIGMPASKRIFRFRIAWRALAHTRPTDRACVGNHVDNASAALAGFARARSPAAIPKPNNASRRYG